MQGSRGDTDIENRLWDTEGECGMTRENSPETHTLPYIKQIASGNLLYDAESSNPVLCDNLEGLDGVGGGREVQGRGHMYTYG